MTVFLVVGAAAVSLALGMWAFRRAYFTERPMRLWSTDFPDAGAVAHALGQRAGLRAEQAPAGSDWIGNFFLAPVWLFWGDLRSGRAETRLSRWRLVGAPAGRELRVQLGPDRVRAAAKLDRAVPLWARTHEALEQQEGLRPFHPVGSPRWVEATTRLRALFAGGADEVRVHGSELTATAALATLSPEKLQVLLFALEALASHLELSC